MTEPAALSRWRPNASGPGFVDRLKAGRSPACASVVSAAAKCPRFAADRRPLSTLLRWRVGGCLLLMLAGGVACSSPKAGSGALVAVDAVSGRQLWRTPLPMATVSQPVVGGGLVIVAGTSDCGKSHLTVVAVHATTGRLAWQRSVKAQHPCSYNAEPHLAGDVVVAGGPLGAPEEPPSGCDQPGVKAPAAVGLDLATGQQRWQPPGIAGEVLAASPDVVVARGANPGCLIGLDAASGHRRWAVTPPVSGLFAAVGAGSLFLSGHAPDGSQAISSLDPITGDRRWSVPLAPSGGIGPLTAAEAVTIWLDIAVISLDPATGRELWRSVAQDDMTWTSRGPGVLLITRLNGGQATVEARDPRTGARRWESAALDPSVSPAATDGTVVVAVAERHADGFRAIDGRPLWADSGAYSAAAVDANAAYLAAAATPKHRPRATEVPRARRVHTTDAKCLVNNSTTPTNIG
jgi:outer membrane protein assembly factor BamB